MLRYMKILLGSVVDARPLSLILYLNMILVSTCEGHPHRCISGFSLSKDSPGG